MQRWFLELIDPRRLVPPLLVSADDALDEGEVRDANGAVAPIRAGVVLLAGADGGDGDTAGSFGFEWGAHLAGDLEQETSFGYSLAQEWDYFLTATQESPDSLVGLTVLDGGCGSGRLTLAMARAGAARVVGVDIHTALAATARRAAGQANLVFARADLAATGLAGESFDLIWSNGVIHHAPDPRACFRELARLVKPGGKLYVWLYGTHWTPLVVMRDLLERFGLREWSHPAILRVSRVCAALLLPVVWGIKLAGWLIPPLGRRAVVRNITGRWHKPGALTMIFFDVLSPRYRFRYTPQTLQEWFAEEGFEVVRVHDYQTGVLGRKRRS